VVRKGEILLNLPLVSVVMPNHNGADFLEEAIESVLNQTYRCLELIVVDDGSDDSSLAILQKYGASLKFISASNNGAAHARNIGISSANGELIAFIDSDDVWAKDKIDKQINLLLEEDLSLVYCSGEEFGESVLEKRTHQARYSGFCYLDFVQNPTTAIIVLGCSTAIIKREVLAKSGLFDVNFKGPAEDWDFFRRVCKIAKVGFVDEKLVKYRIHHRNVSRSSADSYFDGNKMAVSKMLIEDKSINKIKVWRKFYLIFIKHSIKTFNIRLFRRVTFSIIRNSF